jgi:hypothetical protein
MRSSPLEPAHAFELALRNTSAFQVQLSDAKFGRWQPGACSTGVECEGTRRLTALRKALRLSQRGSWRELTQ